MLFCFLLPPARKLLEEGVGASLGPADAQPQLSSPASPDMFLTVLVERSHLGKLRHGTLP